MKTLTGLNASISITGLATSPIQLDGYTEDDRFEWPITRNPRLWHKIVKVEVGVTHFEIITKEGIVATLPLKQGSPTYLAISALEPSAESPFSGSFK